MKKMRLQRDNEKVAWWSKSFSYQGRNTLLLLLFTSSSRRKCTWKRLRKNSLHHPSKLLDYTRFLLSSNSSSSFSRSTTKLIFAWNFFAFLSMRNSRKHSVWTSLRPKKSHWTWWANLLFFSVVFPLVFVHIWQKFNLELCIVCGTSLRPFKIEMFPLWLGCDREKAKAFL